MAANLVLSASSISLYLRCRHAWLLEHVYRAPRRESLRALIGTAAHAGIEAMLRGGEPRGPLLAAWDEGIVRVDLAEADADPDALRDTLAMPEVYRREVMPTFTPDLVESGFAVVPAGLGVVVTGVIDAADTRTDDLRDHKTTAGKTINGVKPHFDPDNYSLQMGLYSIAYRGLTGRRPKRVRLDVLKRSGKHAPYDMAPSESDALDLVAIVRDGVGREDYDPTGATSGKCGWCEYRTRCAHAVLD